MSNDKLFHCTVCGLAVEAKFKALPLAYFLTHGEYRIGVPWDEWLEWGEKPHPLWFSVIHETPPVASQESQHAEKANQQGVESGD